MKQKVKPMQFIEISVHELFAFQDKLDAVKDDTEKVWQVVDDFFWEAEGQLEIDPNFFKELQSLDLDSDYIKIDDLEEWFKELEDESTPSHIDVLKSYKEYKQKQLDIPFTPIHNF